MRLNMFSLLKRKRPYFDTAEIPETEGFRVFPTKPTEESVDTSAPGAVSVTCKKFEIQGVCDQSGDNPLLSQLAKLKPSSVLLQSLPMKAAI